MRDDRKFKIHFGVVANRAEIVIDGSRVYYGPVFEDSQTRKLAVMIKLVGIKGSMSDVTWRTSGDDPQ